MVAIEDVINVKMNTHRLKWNVVNWEDMKAGHAIHHTVVHIASLVMQVHGLQEVVVGLQGEHVELRVCSGVLVNDEMSPFRIYSFLMRVIFFLINLKENIIKHICFLRVNFALNINIFSQHHQIISRAWGSDLCKMFEQTQRSDCDWEWWCW